MWNNSKSLAGWALPAEANRGRPRMKVALAIGAALLFGLPVEGGISADDCCGGMIGLTDFPDAGVGTAFRVAASNRRKSKTVRSKSLLRGEQFHGCVNNQQMNLKKGKRKRPPKGHLGDKLAALLRKQKEDERKRREAERKRQEDERKRKEEEKKRKEREEERKRQEAQRKREEDDRKRKEEERQRRKAEESAAAAAQMAENEAQTVQGENSNEPGTLAAGSGTAGTTSASKSSSSTSGGQSPSTGDNASGGSYEGGPPAPQVVPPPDDGVPPAADLWHTWDQMREEQAAREQEEAENRQRSKERRALKFEARREADRKAGFGNSLTKSEVDKGLYDQDIRDQQRYFPNYSSWLHYQGLDPKQAEKKAEKIFGKDNNFSFLGQAGQGVANLADNPHARFWNQHPANALSFDTQAPNLATVPYSPKTEDDAKKEGKTLAWVVRDQDGKPHHELKYVPASAVGDSKI